MMEDVEKLFDKAVEFPAVDAENACGGDLFTAGDFQCFSDKLLLGGIE
jgi:hypothetical protein